MPMYIKSQLDVKAKGGKGKRKDGKGKGKGAYSGKADGAIQTPAFDGSTADYGVGVTWNDKPKWQPAQQAAQPWTDQSWSEPTWLDDVVGPQDQCVLVDA